MSRLSALPEPPYHLALAITDLATAQIEASEGSLETEDGGRERALDVDLRVGTMQLDNTHKLRDAGWMSEQDRVPLALPLPKRAGGPAGRPESDGPAGEIEDEALLRRLILMATDDAYRAALKRLIKVRANDVVKVEREDRSDDFSPAPAVSWTEEPPPLALTAERWRDVLRDASAIPLAFPEIHSSSVQISAHWQRRALVTAERAAEGQPGGQAGRPDNTVARARICDGWAQYRLAVEVETTAADGMQLEISEQVYADDEAGLPDRAGVEALVRAAAARLAALRAAPLVEPFEGPAILRGRAAGVFFHEVFGHRIEGHRQKDEEEGQTFTSRIGQPVLPEFLSVVDDPTLVRLPGGAGGDGAGAGVRLNGHYRYDDEGVAAERVVLVDRGVLRGFLMGRSPVAGSPRSNGHGRRQPGAAPVARQGNLIVEAHEAVSEARLRELLIAEIRRQRKPFGLIFDDISGGFTMTGRSTPNAFAVQPVTVWKVYPDGRPDELVRGADLIGTPLTTFSRILAAGGAPEVFNGVCGAESGWVPVSACAPALLIQQVEIQRQEKPNDRPPLLPPPAPHALPPAPAPHAPALPDAPPAQVYAGVRR